MRKITYIYAIVCAMAVIFCSTSCTDEYVMKSGAQTEIKDFSLQEAKDFFTKQIEETAMLSRSLDNKENKTMSPGDFVPDWNASVGSSMSGLACYDIPITPTYRYKAVYVDERNGLPSAGKVNVYQKLVIVKDMKNNKLSQYILTLIPSKACDDKYGLRLCSDFINCADKGGFTGVAVYSCVNSNMTARVSKYKNGERIDGVFLLNASSKADFSKKYEHAYALVSNVAVQKKSMIMTRGEMEEEPSWDGGSLPEVVITPEPDYGGWGQADMDDWLESSRPDGTVDPEPTQPEEPVIPEDDVVNPPTNDTEDGDPVLKATLKEIAPILKLKNIDVSKYKIVLNTNQCPVNAQTLPNNVIEICPEFFNHQESSTRASIIWHEIYHINNQHNQTNSTKSPCTEIILVPTGDVLEGLNSYLEWRLNDIKQSAQYQDILQGEKDYMCSETALKNDPQWYLNEIETYKAESNNGIEKDSYYDGFIDFMQWKYEQLYEYSTKK